MSAYIVYQATVTDPEQYERYRQAAGPAVAAAGGRFIARGGDIEVLEGEPPAGRTVLIEFPSMQAAVDFVRGDYQAVKSLREGAAIARMYVVDGVPD